MEDKIENRYLTFMKGQFLMAMPGLLDPNFFQTVTCISEHTEAGAVGIVVNRVHPYLSAKSIFDELKAEYKAGAESIPIYIGGPVHIGEVFVLHGPPFNWQGCLVITPFMAMSNTLDIIKAIAMGKGPKSFIIALGCAGWGQGQLESEIKENTWLTGPIIKEIVFDVQVHTRWEEAVKKIGIDPVLLSEKAGHA